VSEPRIGTPSLLVLAVVAFVVEVALFGGVGVVAHDALGGGVVGWVGAVVATGGVLVLWGLLMAPKARFRLTQGPRVLVALVLTVGTGLGLVQTGHQWWGWFVGVAGLAVVAAQVVLTSDDVSAPHQA